MKNQLLRLGGRPSAATLDRLARLSSLVLVVLLGYSLAELTWALLPAPEQAPPPPAPTAANTPQQQAADYRSLAQLHLFGEAQRDEATQAAPIEAPETRLNLTLRGILYNPNPSQALAIIAGPGGDEKFYGIGASVPGGATIERILADRVILERSGRYETLRLPEDELPDVVRQAPEQGAPQPAGSGVLNNYRREILDNPQNIGQYIRTEPVIEGGRFRGFRLSPGPNSAIFENSPLQPGDLVTSVEGVELDDMEKGFQVIDTIAEAESVQMTIERDGQRQTVQLQFR